MKGLHIKLSFFLILLTCVMMVKNNKKAGGTKWYLIKSYKSLFIMFTPFQVSLNYVHGYLSISVPEFPNIKHSVPRYSQLFTWFLLLLCYTMGFMDLWALINCSKVRENVQYFRGESFIKFFLTELHQCQDIPHRMKKNSEKFNFKVWGIVQRILNSGF